MKIGETVSWEVNEVFRMPMREETTWSALGRNGWFPSFSAPSCVFAPVAQLFTGSPSRQRPASCVGTVKHARGRLGRGLRSLSPGTSSTPRSRAPWRRGQQRSSPTGRTWAWARCTRGRSATLPAEIRKATVYASREEASRVMIQEEAAATYVRTCSPRLAEKHRGTLLARSPAAGRPARARRPLRANPKTATVPQAAPPRSPLQRSHTRLTCSAFEFLRKKRGWQSELGGRRWSLDRERERKKSTIYYPKTSPSIVSTVDVAGMKIVYSFKD